MCLKQSTRSCVWTSGRSSQAWSHITPLYDKDCLLYISTGRYGYDIILQVHKCTLYHCIIVIIIIFVNLCLTTYYNLCILLRLYSMSDNQVDSTTPAPPAPKRPKLRRPPPLKVRPSPLLVTEVKQQRGVTYNRKGVRIGGRYQPSLNISFTCSQPTPSLTSDKDVQATCTMKDCSIDVNTREIDYANEMLTINYDRFNFWMLEVIKGAYVIKFTRQSILPSPIHSPDPSPLPDYYQE